MSSLRDQLEEVRRIAGKLTPPAVVAAARPIDSTLHDRFEWDDTIAAEKYRHEQAAQLIRSVKVTYVADERGPRTVRSYLAVRADEDATTREYVPTEEVVTDPLMRRIVLRDMERDIAILKARYGHLEEFAEILLRETGVAA